MKLQKKAICLAVLLPVLILCSSFLGAATLPGEPEPFDVIIEDSEPGKVEASSLQGTVNAQTPISSKKSPLPTEGKVSADSVNVRDVPWGNIIGTLPKGTPVKIIGQSGDWYKISYKGSAGYILDKFLSIPGVASDPITKGRVSGNSIAVRRVPGGDVIGTLSQGEEVDILGETKDFYRISYKGSDGYVSKKYIDNAKGASAPAPSKPDSYANSFTAYITASSLNIRQSPWGKIGGTLKQGAAVKVTGKVGIWYTIDWEGKTAYIPAEYVDRQKPAPGAAPTNKLPVLKPKPVTPTPASAPVPTPPTPSGSLQQKVASSARALLGSTRFRGPEVDYGNLACAQVATTALKNAGALDKVYLNCTGSVNALKAKGWVEVSEPFREGDVITWTTYLPGDSHIGIIVKEGNTFKAMNNSSSKRTPVLSDPHSMKICRILRKP